MISAQPTHINLMSFLSTLISPVTSIVQPVLGIFEKRGEAKHAEIAGEQEQEKLETAVKHEENVAEINGANAYDVQALQNQIKDWGDDYLLIVMTFPFVIGFLPGLQPVVAAGWAALQLAPAWYPTILIGITAAKFGLRWLFQKK